jgi:hypothetical protein
LGDSSRKCLSEWHSRGGTFHRPGKKVKAVKAKKEKKPAKSVKPKADTTTLFAHFKAAKMVKPFKETVKDHKRFNVVAGADKFEDALPGFKDEMDLKGFIGYCVQLPGPKSNTRRRG